MAITVYEDGFLLRMVIRGRERNPVVCRSALAVRVRVTDLLAKRFIDAPDDLLHAMALDMTPAVWRDHRWQWVAPTFEVWVYGLYHEDPHARARREGWGAGR